MSSVSPADGHFSAISVENENTLSHKYYRRIVSKSFGLSHTTRMHYFFSLDVYKVKNLKLITDWSV